LERRKTYFASDFHLGLSAGTDPLEREKRVTAWLKEISDDASAVYLLGDIFDFWWEYTKVVPKGFTRFLGTISNMTDSGIKVFIFTGNHDMWMKDYLVKECGVHIITRPLLTAIDGKRFYLAHGEGLGSKNIGFKLLLAFFHWRFAQRVYSTIDPRYGIGFGHAWSKSSRLAKGISVPFMGEEKEDLIRYTKQIIGEGCDADFFIYGHRHLPLSINVQGKKMVILGDWFKRNCYAIWDGTSLEFKSIPV
jgi:UDP-2,3-diacylglucosamine hydrolase